MTCAEQDAIMYAANVGRDGRGALILVASGNGAYSSDSCAFDGYATSVHTFTIGTVLFHSLMSSIVSVLAHYNH